MPAKGTTRIRPETVEKMLELQARCWSRERIAAELGLARETVCRHLEKLNRAAAARLGDRVALVKAQQVDRLEHTWPARRWTPGSDRRPIPRAAPIRGS